MGDFDRIDGTNMGESWWVTFVLWACVWLGLFMVGGLIWWKTHP